MSDPELSSELAQHREGRERSDFAITAMKIDVMALSVIRVDPVLSRRLKRRTLHGPNSEGYFKHEHPTGREYQVDLPHRDA